MQICPTAGSAGVFNPLRHPILHPQSDDALKLASVVGHQGGIYGQREKPEGLGQFEGLGQLRIRNFLQAVALIPDYGASPKR